KERDGEGNVLPLPRRSRTHAQKVRSSDADARENQEPCRGRSHRLAVPYVLDDMRGVQVLAATLVTPARPIQARLRLADRISTRNASSPKSSYTRTRISNSLPAKTTPRLLLAMPPGNRAMPKPTRPRIAKTSSCPFLYRTSNVSRS